MTDQDNLKYTAEHEWVSIDGDIATVGITAFAADKLGDVVYVDLPAVGSEISGDPDEVVVKTRLPSASRPLAW